MNELFEISIFFFCIFNNSPSCQIYLYRLLNNVNEWDNISILSNSLSIGELIDLNLPFGKPKNRKILLARKVNDYSNQVTQYDSTKKLVCN